MSDSELRIKLLSLRLQFVLGESAWPGMAIDKSQFAAGIEDLTNLPSLPYGERELNG